MIKLLTYLFFALLPCLICAQTKVVKYFDDSWSAAEQQRSTYTAEFIKENDNYKCTLYWTSSGAVAGRAIYADTTLAKPVGSVVGYYKNGKVEDSSFYDGNSSLVNAFHYYQGGQLKARYQSSGEGKDPTIEAFDESGKKIKNYIYAREAEFTGGDKAWKAYIEKNVSKEFRIKGNGEQVVHVKVLFAVNEYGSAVKVKVIESSGIKQVDNDAVRVIMNSPSWKPAIYLNQPVKAYRIQPFTYVLSPEKN